MEINLPISSFIRNAYIDLHKEHVELCGGASPMSFGTVTRASLRGSNSRNHRRQCAPRAVFCRARRTPTPGHHGSTLAIKH
jgi:hypothetical protein